MVQDRAQPDPERLAYWYYRLNGFLTTENFIVHPDRGKAQRTDADMLAVRFQHRQENAERPMVDDVRVADCDTLVNVVITEIKKGRCMLNGPWTDPSKANMERVLRAVGCVPISELDAAAQALYQVGTWSDADATVRLFALGQEKNPTLPIPESQQLTWDEVIEFCVQRLHTYRAQKSSTVQWEADGLLLKRLAGRRYANAEIRLAFGLSTQEQSKERMDT